MGEVRLRSLQRDILAVLEEWPTFEWAKAAAPGNVKDWALPRDIIRGLGRPNTCSTQGQYPALFSDYMRRELVARASGELADVGKAFHYLRITNPVNAGAGNNGPTIILVLARRWLLNEKTAPATWKQLGPPFQYAGMPYPGRCISTGLGHPSAVPTFASFGTMALGGSRFEASGLRLPKSRTGRKPHQG